MTNLFTNLSKNVLCTVNGPRMDRHHIENGPIHSRQLFAILVMLLCLGVGDAWGTEIYRNEGAAVSSGAGTTTSGTTATINNTAGNGNPAPSWGMTSNSKTTLTLSNFNVTSYSSRTLSVDAAFKSFPYTTNTWPYVTVTLYKNSVSVYTNNATIKWSSKDNSYGTYTFENLPDFDKIVFVHSPAIGKTQKGADNTSYACYLDNIVLTGTAACSYNVTLSYDGDASGLHGSFVLKEGSASGATIAEGGTTANCGTGATSVVVVPTPDEHYHVASVSATNKTGTISGPDGDGNYTISYTQGSNISSTVTVGFEEDTKYTVTWMSNGSQHTTTQVYSGEKPTFPTNPSSCDGTSTAFYGWATATWTGKLNDVSSKTIYLSGDAMPAVSGAVTYYAVFAKESATAFEKITSADNIYIGQKIAIVSNKQDYILPSNFNATTAATHPNSNDNKLTVTSSQVWTITDIDEYGYYKLKNSTMQMGVNRTSGLTSGSAAVGNYSTVASWWAINETTDFDYTVDDCFYMYNWATATYYNFLENSGSSWLSYYAADITSGNKVWYAMKLYQPERSEFLTTCCTQLGSINGSFF